MSENENQEPGIVRADYLQRFTARQRMQARTNIRAAKLPDITQAFVYGLDLLALTPLSPPAGMLNDDGGAVLVSVTPLGNWSSDGTDAAPLVGPWLYLIKTTATETVDGETDEADEAFPPVTQNITHWDIQYWEDGAQDTGFAWQSEKLHADLAEDLFMFRLWRPVPDDEETQSTVWIQPIEPEPTGMAGLSAYELAGGDAAWGDLATWLSSLEGPEGPAGPNIVTTSTSTNITGLLKGNGTNVVQAVAGTDYCPAAGSTNVVTLGIVTTGTWQGTVVSPIFGGTGVNNGAKTITLGASLTTTGTGSPTLAFPSSSATYTFPSSSAMVARTDAAQTFSGVQTFSDQPIFTTLHKCSVYHSADQTLAASTVQQILFDTKLYDTGNNYSILTSKWTAPFACYVRVTCMLTTTTLNSAQTELKLYKNSSTEIGRLAGATPAGNGAYLFGGSRTVQVAAGDTLEIKAYSLVSRTIAGANTISYLQIDILP